MAKSLGQIHSVNESITVAAVNDRYNIDIPGQLTEQLNRMVRAGTFHKCVGIDITLDPALAGTASGGQVTGRLLYYAPTRGRCAAFRSAFKAMAEQMKTQGVAMRDNMLYDFRAPLNNNVTINTFNNRSTLDGVNGLALNHASAGSSIFGVHNSGIQPINTATSRPLFSSGFDTLLQGSGGTDFVLNDTQPYSGNTLSASLDYEEIPFAVSYEPATPGTTSATVTWQWRPDPALYVAMLCGQIQLVVDEVDLTSASSAILQVNVMVSGWKSIMGSPDKKPRRSKKRSGMKKA